MRHVLASIIVMTMLATTSGCPWWQHHSDTVVKTAIDCTVAAVKQNEPQLLPKVLDILTGGAPDWKTQLKLLETVGLEAFACTLQAALNLLLQTVAPDAGIAVIPGGGSGSGSGSGSGGSPGGCSGGVGAGCGGLLANRNRATFNTGAQRAQQYLTERGFKFKH